MPNGKPGDNPIDDMMVYGKHRFPADIETMIRMLFAIDPKIVNDLIWELFEWEKGNNLDDARKKLKELIAKHDK